jgi:hypothetical protein
MRDILDDPELLSETLSARPRFQRKILPIVVRTVAKPEPEPKPEPKAKPEEEGFDEDWQPKRSKKKKLDHRAPDGKRRPHVGFRLDPKALEKIDHIAVKTNRRRSDVIRGLIYKGLRDDG